MLRLASLALVVALAACSSSSSTAMDMSFPFDLSFVSKCGHPGDTGNSVGVGKFCQEESDCVGNGKANLCSQLGASDEYFCTFPCSGGDAGASECGENAICACGSGSSQSGCGCYPDRCITM